MLFPLLWENSQTFFQKNEKFSESQTCESFHIHKLVGLPTNRPRLTASQLVETNSDDGRWTDRHRIWQLFFRNSGPHMAPAKIPKHRLPAGACENFHKVAPIRNKTRQKTHMMKNYLQKSHLFWYNIKKRKFFQKISKISQNNWIFLLFFRINNRKTRKN